MARDKLQIPNMVTIGGKSAAAIFNMGQKRWKRLFDEVYHQYVRYTNGVKERRYVLYDVMVLAYPNADNRTLHSLCMEFTLRRADHRMETWGRSRKGEDSTDET